MSKSAPLSPLSSAFGRTPYSYDRPNLQEGGRGKKNHNLKEAKAKKFCKTPSHREMSKEYQELSSDFSINK